MALTDDLRAAKQVLIDTIGGGNTVVLVKKTITQNTLSGKTEITSSPTTVSAARTRYMEDEIDGTNVQIGDQKFHLSATDLVAAAVVPDQDDVIREGSRRWQILRVMTNQPNVLDDPVAYICHCRQEGS